MGMAAQGTDGVRQRPHEGGRGGYHPAVFVLLSAVTVLWLLTQLAAGLRETNSLYPVTAYAMFSHPTQGRDVHLVLSATYPDGRTAEVAAEDFGLSALQLRAYLARSVGGSADTARPEAEARLARLAELWSERHGAELSSLTAWRVEYTIEAPAAIRQEVARWSE